MGVEIPKEFWPIIGQSILDAQRRREAEGLSDGQMVGLLRTEVAKRLAAAGKDPKEIPSEYYTYLAGNLGRVFRWALGVAKANPPSHRRGIGEPGELQDIQVPPFHFPFEGTPGHTPPPGGDSEPPPDGDEDGDDGSVVDWAPASEEARAKAMLDVVADEMGFGPYDAPLPFVREVARRLGGRWGLNGKRGNPNDLSGDVLAWNIPGHLPQLFDVIYDSGGKNSLVWNRLPYARGPAIWVAP